MLDKEQDTIKSYHIYCIVRLLSRLDDGRVAECVPDDLVEDIFKLLEKLETASDYMDYNWESDIQMETRRFKANIVRVKQKPGTRYVSSLASNLSPAAHGILCSFRMSPEISTPGT